MSIRVQVIIITVLFSLIANPAIVSVQAHTASQSMVLIRENGFSHSVVEIIQNDSVLWENVDNSSNLTHRIVYDHDGDGLYNGTFDWDSGELVYECERNETNVKVDANCSDTFMIIFDLNWSIGNYSYQDIRSDGSVVNATISVLVDTYQHVEANVPSIGSEFGVNNDDQETTTGANNNNDDQLTPEKMLLYVGLFTGITSILLVVLLIARRSGDDDLIDVLQQEKSESE